MVTIALLSMASCSGELHAPPRGGPWFRKSLSAHEDAESVIHELPPADSGTFAPMPLRRLRGDKFQFTKSSGDGCGEDMESCGRTLAFAEASWRLEGGIAGKLLDKLGEPRGGGRRTGREGGGGRSAMSGSLRTAGALLSGGAGGSGGSAGSRTTVLIGMPPFAPVS